MVTTVDIVLGSVQTRAAAGGTLPLAETDQIDQDLITSSGTSQQSDFAVPANSYGLVWIITATGGAIRAKFGTNPTAAAAEGGGWLILAETTREFVAQPGHKVAIIDA